MLYVNACQVARRTGDYLNIPTYLKQVLLGSAEASLRLRACHARMEALVILGSAVIETSALDGALHLTRSDFNYQHPGLEAVSLLFTE